MPLPRTLFQRGSIEEILLSQKLIVENIEKLRDEQPEHLAPVNDGVIQCAPGDVRNVNVDGIVDKLWYVEGMYNSLCFYYRQQSLLPPVLGILLSSKTSTYTTRL